MRVVPALLFLSMAAISCGSEPNHISESSMSSQSTGLTGAIRSAGFDLFPNSGDPRSMVFVVSDSDNVCADMQAHRNQPNSHRLVFVVKNTFPQRAPFLGTYPVAREDSNLYRVATARREILDDTCTDQSAPIVSGSVVVDAASTSTQLATLRYALDSADGPLQGEVSAPYCPGIAHLDTLRREQWPCAGVNVAPKPAVSAGPTSPSVPAAGLACAKYRKSPFGAAPCTPGHGAGTDGRMWCQIWPATGACVDIIGDDNLFWAHGFSLESPSEANVVACMREVGIPVDEGSESVRLWQRNNVDLGIRQGCYELR